MTATLEVPTFACEVPETTETTLAPEEMHAKLQSQPPALVSLLQVPTKQLLMCLTATYTALLVLCSLPWGSAIQCKSSANPASPSQYSLWLLNFLTVAHSSSAQLQMTLLVLSNPRLTSTCRLLTPTLSHSSLVPHSQPLPHSPINTARPLS